MGRARITAVAAVLCALAAAAGPAAAEPRDQRLTLSPSRAIGTAHPGVTVGPFGLANTTRARFAMTAFPVLLGQDRDGGIFARTDAASRRRAARLLDVSGGRSRLAPGGRIEVTARLSRPSASGGFYGGVLLRNEPAGKSRQSIRQAYELNASLLLRPPSGERRVHLMAPGVEAEQTGSRRLRFLAAVRNAGNVDVRLRGRLRIRRHGSEEVLVRRRLRMPRVLPGSVVDLSAGTRRADLPAGRYRAVADIRGGGKRIRAVGRFVLHGTDALASRRATFVEAEPGRATIGEPIELRAEWRNRGNVPFAARAVADVRAVLDDGIGRRIATTELRSESAAPKEAGELRGELPELAAGNYEVTLRLLDGGRELDRRTFAVSPAPAVPLHERLVGWLAGHPLLAPLVLLVMLLVAGGVLVPRWRRLKVRLAEMEADG